MIQPLGPIFTLTQLQEFLDFSDRRKLRNHLLPKGAPYMNIGREPTFEMETFLTWVRGEIAKQQDNKTPNPESEAA